MPKREGVRLVRDFLLKNLDQNTFGEELQWIDAPTGKFGMTWVHKSNGSWIRGKHGAVYEAWAKCKNLWDSRDPKAISKAKQRFRSALRKLPNVKPVERTQNYRTYMISNITELRRQGQYYDYSPSVENNTVYDSGYESGSLSPDVNLFESAISTDDCMPDWAKEEYHPNNPILSGNEKCFIGIDFEPFLEHC